MNCPRASSSDDLTTITCRLCGMNWTSTSTVQNAFDQPFIRAMSAERLSEEHTWCYLTPRLSDAVKKDRCQTTRQLRRLWCVRHARSRRGGLQGFIGSVSACSLGRMQADTSHGRWDAYANRTDVTWIDKHHRARSQVWDARQIWGHGNSPFKENRGIVTQNSQGGAYPNTSIVGDSKWQRNR